MPFDNSQEEPFGDIELLRLAKGLINTQAKWAKHVYYNEGRHCAVAALSAACTGVKPDKRLTKQGKRLARHLCREARGPELKLLWFLTARLKLIAYNDMVSTTHDDMMALFDHAIDRLYHEKAKLQRTIESY